MTRHYQKPMSGRRIMQQKESEIMEYMGARLTEKRCKWVSLQEKSKNVQLLYHMNATFNIIAFHPSLPPLPSNTDIWSTYSSFWLHGPLYMVHEGYDGCLDFILFRCLQNPGISSKACWWCSWSPRNQLVACFLCCKLNIPLHKAMQASMASSKWTMCQE